MKNGWYLIKTWEKMKEEIGLTDNGNINGQEIFSQIMEDSLPPSRCIYIKDDCWNGFPMHPYMIATKAFKVGTICEVSNFATGPWKKRAYVGYHFINGSHVIYDGGFFKYRHCREIQPENEENQKILVEIEAIELRIADLGSRLSDLKKMLKK